MGEGRKERERRERAGNFSFYLFIFVNLKIILGDSKTFLHVIRHDTSSGCPRVPVSRPTTYVRSPGPRSASFFFGF